MEQDASLGGQFYGVYRKGSDGIPRLRRLRPDWVDILIGSPSQDPFDIDAEVGAYFYHPNGRGQTKAKPVLIEPEFMVHYAPIPDPEARYRGMSWLSPVVEEIRKDVAATRHGASYFDNAATPNLAVTMPQALPKDQFLDLVRDLDQQHQGVANAYKTMWLMGGSDIRTVGNSLKDMDYKAVQGAGETRIAAAGGVPPIIVGLSEGLEAATYSNYGQARRAFADLWARPAWRDAAGALQKVLAKPSPTSELWYDESGISFLQEDQMDAAEILSRRMLTIEAGVRAGFDPETVVTAVDEQNLQLLQHTGLYSVQLQPPTDGQPPAVPAT
jgi:phage portal protein BeeE